MEFLLKAVYYTVVVHNFNLQEKTTFVIELTHCKLGLDRTGHMSFLTGQDRTPKFAGQVLPDRTISGLIFLNILPTKYGLSILIR